MPARLPRVTAVASPTVCHRCRSGGDDAHEPASGSAHRGFGGCAAVPESLGSRRTRAVRDPREITMAGYLYQCGVCGPWEIQRPIGTAAATSTCPGCGAPGRRVYTSPLLSRTPKAVSAARLREEASARRSRGHDEPAASGGPDRCARPAVERPAASLRRHSNGLPPAEGGGLTRAGPCIHGSATGPDRCLGLRSWSRLQGADAPWSRPPGRPATAG